MEKLAQTLADTAFRAMLYEVGATPKPGLVDRCNNGAHTDMDYFTFVDSAVAITPYFKQLALLGAEHKHLEPPVLLDNLRKTGIEAEKSMLSATNGINTHKGAIFSIGIICAAVGYLCANGKNCDTDAVLGMCAKMSEGRLMKELSAVTSPKTAGERLFISHNVTGVRGEAASGFATVRRHGLPVLKTMLEKGHSMNDAGVITLISLLGHVCDTNLLKRSGGVSEAMAVQKRAREVYLRIAGMDSNSLDLREVAQMDEEFINRNISPGGCADLLIVAFMLFFLENLEKTLV